MDRIVAVIFLCCFAAERFREQEATCADPGFVCAADHRRLVFGDHQFPSNPFGGHSSGHWHDGTSYMPCNPAQSVCHLTCSAGYVKGPNGCDFCACVVDNYKDQTTSGSVLSNQPGTVFGGSSMSYHPCLPSQRTCHLQCRGGYTKGPGGCHFCMCAPTYDFTTRVGVFVNPTEPASKQPVQTAKASSARTSPVSPPKQTSTVISMTVQPTDSCSLAKSNCLVACGAGGYLTDPTDCTVCVCKSSILGR